jgi:4-amino-4-deoxy-L-arabinose transferase-like glycosyltransferase
MSDASPLALDADHATWSSSWKRRAVAMAVLLLGAVLALTAMCARPSLPGGFFIGLVGTAVATGATLVLLDTFYRPGVARTVPLSEVVWPLALVAAAALVSFVALRLAVVGVVPAQTLTLAVLVPFAFIWLAGAAATVAQRLGFLPDPELPLWRRHGFWLLALTMLVYLPRLGSIGLIDPWETHYGEVAREMLSRDDWISLWWAQDGWFWSKPILNFWAQGLSFAAFGVKWGSDQMLQGVALGRVPQPEWAARLPVLLMAVVGQQLLYIGVRPYVGRLAAFLGGLVLATTPYWYLLAHQSMADMAYVGPLCAAMGLFLLALRAEPSERVRTVEVPLWGSVSLRLSGYHLLFGCVLVLLLPQVLYLVSRNVTLDWGELPRLRLHADHVMTGSPGNCGLPGNTECRPDTQANGAPLQPAAAALIWAGFGALLLGLRRGELRFKRLCYLAAWLFVGLSFMGKGAPGLVLALATLGGFVIVRGRASELRHMDLLGFGLLLASVVLPWFVQEYLRHGSEFFERLFIHDMYKRAFSHVHDTNKGDDTSFRYYVWQLGYGLFPWSGLAAAGTLFCLGKSASASTREPRETAGASLGALSDVTYFCLLWQLAAFGMFAITGTKFHHYILPLVPAVALPTGVLLAALLRPALGRPGSLAEPVWALGAAVLVGLVGRDLAMTRQGDVAGGVRFLHLFTYNYARSWPDTLDYSRVLALFTLVAVTCCLFMLVRQARRWAALGLCACSLVVSGWALNVYMVQIAPHWGQRETITEYYKQRSGPEEPLVAYQLNWKGENFYTGNKVPAFVSSGKRFTEWVSGQRKSGVKVMFFTTEHSRIGTLKREIGSHEKFELLTDATLNDKFVLARVAL